MISPAGVFLVGLSQSELQALHGLKFESRLMRTFHSPTSTGHEFASDPQFEPDVIGFNYKKKKKRNCKRRDPPKWLVENSKLNQN